MPRRKSGIEVVTSFFLAAPLPEVEAALAAARAIVALRANTGLLEREPRVPKAPKVKAALSAAASALAARDKDKVQ